MNTIKRTGPIEKVKYGYAQHLIINIADTGRTMTVRVFGKTKKELAKAVENEDVQQYA